MKNLFCVLACLLIVTIADSQSMFNGIYQSTQEGRKLITQLNNVNGKVTGTSAFADGKGAKTFYSGVVNGSILTGKLKDDLIGLEIRFEATDDGKNIYLEMKGTLLELTQSKEERTFVLVKIGADITEAVTSSSKLDGRLFGSWLNHDGNIYEGLRLTSGGKCQRSSAIQVEDIRSGSPTSWEGNMTWYVEENSLYIVEDNFAVLEGTYMVNSEGMLLIKDGKKKYYSKFE